MAGTSTNEKEKEFGEKKKPFRPFSKKQGEEKVATKLPILKYGKGNNFVKFKTALVGSSIRRVRRFRMTHQAREVLRTWFCGA
jgi:hypothetical protein